MGRTELADFVATGGAGDEGGTHESWRGGRFGAWPWVGTAASAVFLAHAAWFASWIVDDAGISFAYARQLAHGEGLIAQAGAAPVEGFTNLSWVLLLAATHEVSGLPIETAAKWLSIAATIGGFFLLARGLVDGRRMRSASVALALSASAAATPFAVWSVSGLENGLLSLAVALVVWLTISTSGRLHAGRPEWMLAFSTGVAIFLLGATRPDQLILLPVPALVWAAQSSRSSRDKAVAARRWALLGFLVPWVCLTGARVAYFGDVLPNTYYAKRGIGWRLVVALLDRAGTIVGSILFLLVSIAAVVLSMAIAGRFGRWLGDRFAQPGVEFSLFAFAVGAGLVPVLLPSDWMPEWRFATSFFLLAPLALSLGAERLGSGSQRRLSRSSGVVVSALCLIGAACYSAIHTPRFVAAPAIPLSGVQQLARALDAAARAAHLTRPTILMPDIGGALWEDRFEVVDLAGLIDRRIARLSRRDLTAFRREVIEDRRPDLVCTHGYWSRLFQWPKLPGFLERYVRVWPLDSEGSPGAAIYLRRDLSIAPEEIGSAFEKARLASSATTEPSRTN